MRDTETSKQETEQSLWRFCVAPMMDWTDSEKSMLYVNRLQWREATCRNNVVVARARACGRSHGYWRGYDSIAELVDLKNGLFYQLARGRNDRTAIALLLSLALASGALAARFELDANTIAYKDAKTLAVVFKAANERQIELKASDLAMAAFILSMTKVWCKALPAGDAVRN